ncbi:MAG: peptidyl-prolyl cis-trans isomerase [Deltaproteobacteria bacterium]|nr:peptidyl-prolyl cis-trans isomerase [Deltaproteobacteria bacterium]
MPAKPSRSGRAAALCAVALLGAAGLALAARPEERVVARVGGEALTTAELERMLARVPPYQLRSFGKNDDEIRHEFLDRAVVRDRLFAQAATEAKLGERADVRERILGVLRSALIAQERTQYERSATMGEAEIAAFYESHRSDYVRTQRLKLARIVLGTAKDAQELIASLGKDSSEKHWGELCRARSLDKATAIKGGNLGFVAEDGSTAQKGVRVNPALYRAALGVEDGQVVPEPVPDGGDFAVVRRRGTMKAVTRRLEDEREGIRRILQQQKFDQRLRELVDNLRRERGVQSTPQLVDTLAVDAQGDIAPMRRPGALERRHPSAGPARPAGEPGQMR